MPVRTPDIFADVVSKFFNDSNAYVAKFLEAQTSGNLPIAMGPALKGFPGNWRQQFKAMPATDTPRHLVVEIGCHTGHTLCDMAEAFPETLFVGVDITFKRVVQTAERAQERGIKNIFAVLANARGLQDLFAPEEVNGFVTFFPDPWKKRKHEHNRLYNDKFCTTIHKHLAPGGFLWLKTDQLPYFNDAVRFVDEVGLTETTTLPVFADHDFSSFFLRRFELQGLPWYGRKWLKNHS